MNTDPQPFTMNTCTKERPNVPVHQAYRKEGKMNKEATPSKRRSVSKARLLKEVIATVEEYKLTDSDPISSLIGAVEKSIIAEAMAK